MSSSFRSSRTRWHFSRHSDAIYCTRRRMPWWSVKWTESRARARDIETTARQFSESSSVHSAINSAPRSDSCGLEYSLIGLTSATRQRDCLPTNRRAHNTAGHQSGRARHSLRLVVDGGGAAHRIRCVCLVHNFAKCTIVIVYYLHVSCVRSNRECK